MSLLFAVGLGACLGGCQEDRAAVEALKQRATRLSDMIDEQNDKLTSLADKIEDCQGDLADATGKGVIENVGSVKIDAPVLVGEESMASLERYEAALTKT
ncbi:MAG: hypothetical protein WBG86_21075, partial [Polyangiales bacterium]